MFQVIDESTMLVQAFFPGENNRMASEKIIVRIRNVNTKDATDGREFDLPQVFEIADTSTYKTATGSNTVFLLEPLNVEAIEAILKK